VIPAAESRVIARRVALGIAGGALTIVSLAISTHTVLSWVTVAVGAVTLAAAAMSLRAARLRPTADGAAGDLAFDVGVRVPSTRLALWIVGVVVLCIAAAGVVQSDPIDGAVRAFGDGGLCFVTYLLAGRFFGLRRQPA
jgi:hypothetical protein